MGHLVLWERHSVNTEMNEQVNFSVVMVSLKEIKHRMGASLVVSC